MIALTGVVRADQNDPRLDALFAQLEETDDPDRGRVLTDEIWQIWVASEDNAANDLMGSGIAFMAQGQMLAALMRFDKLVEIAPGFAEAWNKRATVNYLLERYQESIDDIERTLVLEPRHFGALAGLGLIYADTGKEEIALRAFERALEINPHLPGARENIETLRRRLKDRSI